MNSIQKVNKHVVGTYLVNDIEVKLKEDAQKNKRSVSSQIAWIVENYYLAKENINAISSNNS